MSLSHECRHCAGTGQEAPLGVNGYGTVYAGVCFACGGKGLVRHVPAPRPADPYHDFTPEERRQMAACRAEAEADRDAYLNFVEHHEHHVA